MCDVHVYVGVGGYEYSAMLACSYVCINYFDQISHLTLTHHELPVGTVWKRHASVWQKLLQDKERAPSRQENRKKNTPLTMY